MYITLPNTPGQVIDGQLPCVLIFDCNAFFTSTLSISLLLPLFAISDFLLSFCRCVIAFLIVWLFPSAVGGGASVGGLLLLMVGSFSYYNYIYYYCCCWCCCCCCGCLCCCSAIIILLVLLWLSVVVLLVLLLLLLVVAVYGVLFLWLFIVI